MSDIKYIFCLKSYKDKIQSFINNNWKKDHILSKSAALLDWQYMNKTCNYNFVLALENNNIIGLLGFIPPSRYSNNLSDNSIWLALWFIKKNISYPGLGIGMIAFLKKEKNLKKIYTIGLSEDSINIYKALKYNVGYLKHFVLVNSNIKKFNILKLQDRKIIKTHAILENDCLLEEINRKDFLKNNYFNSNNFYKNKEYIVNKYLNHPFYKYKLFVIKNQNNLCLFIAREVCVNKSFALRIIDCFGEHGLLSNVGDLIMKLLINENYEYIDFLQHGIDPAILKKAGFINVDDYNDIVIPNYFEPFEQSKKRVYFAFKNFDNNHDDDDDANELFFKGDGDQDRPNVI